jgi:DNA polymerase-1
VSSTYDAVSAFASKGGYIRTILGRKRRFNLWEPADGYDKPLPKEQAIVRYGRVRRAFGHKALNSLLQGSAADLMKKALVDCYEAGLPLPLTTVHDETNFTDPGDQDEAFMETKIMMEKCLILNVPVLADEEVGPSWGECK